MKWLWKSKPKTDWKKAFRDLMDLHWEYRKMYSKGTFDRFQVEREVNHIIKRNTS